MCDIWKANHDKREISSNELHKHISSFKKLGVKHVTLSGGEALMHSNLWNLCAQLKGIGARISLLSTGLTLEAHANEIITHVDDLIVSLDGSRAVHNQIRGIPRAFEKLHEGVRTLKARKPSFRITGRCVLQRLNYRDFPNIIDSAITMGLDQISFLAADVSTTAFNRSTPWGMEKTSEIGLTEEETQEFENIIEKSMTDFSDLYRRRFIAEAPSKMFELAQYYRGLVRDVGFPTRRCNAPWVSAVIEADGQVRPCFFHGAYGNIHERDFSEIINSSEAIMFRRKLNVKKDLVCKRCVCSLKL